MRSRAYNRFVFTILPSLAMLELLHPHSQKHVSNRVLCRADQEKKQTFSDSVQQDFLYRLRIMLLC